MGNQPLNVEFSWISFIFSLFFQVRIWKIIDIIQESTTFLAAKGIENPRLNAEQLLGHLLKLSRVDLYVQFDRPLNKQEREDYKVLLKRRAEREPLQYILGSTEFMSLPFKVTPAVLIPRPETEILVENIMQQAKDNAFDILDIGTGSGCIAISLAHYCPDCQLIGWDKSEEALKIARANAEFNQVQTNINWYVVDILNRSANENSDKFDIIVSNPPYVSENEWQQLEPELKDHEPKTALSDSADGLTFYKRITQIAKDLLKPKGQLLFEVGDGQAQFVHEIMKNAEFHTIEMIQDLNQITRVIKGEK